MAPSEMDFSQTNMVFVCVPLFGWDRAAIKCFSQPNGDDQSDRSKKCATTGITDLSECNGYLKA